MSVAINLKIRTGIETLLTAPHNFQPKGEVCILTIKNLLSSDSSSVKTWFNLDENEANAVDRLTKFLLGLEPHCKGDVEKQLLKETFHLILHQLKIDSQHLKKILRLHEVARVNAVSLCQLFLENGAEINQPLSKEVTLKPLHIAVQNGNYEVSKKLIELGALVNDQAFNGRITTPIQEALSQDNEKLVELLYQNGATIDHSYFEDALNNDMRKSIEVLLRKGYRPSMEEILKNQLLPKIEQYCNEKNLDLLAYYTNVLRGILGLGWIDFRFKTMDEGFVVVYRDESLNLIHTCYKWHVKDHSDIKEFLNLITSLLKDIK